MAQDMAVIETETEGGADQAQVRQFVTFYLGDDCFAFPMETVLEIIRVPGVVHVPLAPRGFVGLANLRGAILPIMNLRTTLSMEDRATDDAARTVVVDCGRPVGLIVDRVSRVVSFADERIEQPDANSSLGAAVAEGVLAGVVKDTGGTGLIQILDARSAVNLQSITVAVARSAAAGPARDADRNGGASAEQTGDTVQLVNLVIDDQEFAFEISEVDEIVRPPETIFQVPRAAPHALGMINLRNRLLPIVSLRRMFHLADLPLAETNRILVVRIGSGDRPDARVGIVVDQVREVLTVSARDRVKVSSLMSSDGVERVATMCRLDDGNRLVGVLTCRTLFQDGSIQDMLEAAAEASETEEQSEGIVDSQEDGDETQLVVYQLAGQEYGVEINAVREIIRVPPSLKRVPKAPSYVAGIINLRGGVLPVVTMRTRFSIADETRSDRQRIIVLNRDGRQTGFIVDAVTEVLRLSRSAIEPAPDLSAEQSRLIGTVANIDEGRRIIQILNAQALLASDEFNTQAEEPVPALA